MSSCWGCRSIGAGIRGCRVTDGQNPRKTLLPPAPARTAAPAG